MKNISKYSISFIVIVIIVVITSLPLIVIGVINYRTESSSVWEAFNNKKRMTLEPLANSLAIPLWSFDEIQLSNIMESAMSDREVYAVEVRSTAQSNIKFRRFVKIRDAQWNIIETQQNDFPSELVGAEKLIYFSEENIGTVKIYLTPKFVLNNLRGILIISLVSIIFLDMILVLNLYYLLWKIIIKPLRSLEQYTVAVSNGKTPDEKFIELKFYGELFSFRNAIEKMVK